MDIDELISKLFEYRSVYGNVRIENGIYPESMTYNADYDVLILCENEG